MNDSSRPHPRTSPWSAPDGFRPHLPPTTPAPATRRDDPVTGTGISAGSAADERLARLAARRAANGAPGTTNGRGSASSGTPGARTNGSTRPTAGSSAKRSHPAGRARASALALSVTTTVGLAAYLHETGSVSASSADTAVISGSLTADTTAAADTAGATASTAVASSASATAATTAETTAATAATTAATTASTETTAATKTTTAVDASGLADGTYVGDTSTNKWGPVQVQITVSGGEITSVDVLQYPADDHKSVSINQRALPTLISSTLSVQSADVDTVSGATYTSESYRESLQTAIDEARAAATATAG